LAQPGGHGAGGDHEGLLGEIEVDVWFLEEGSDLVDEGPAAVQENEVCVAQAWVVEERFEQERVVACDGEVASAARDGVEVDGEVEAAALGCDVTEEEVLEALVLCFVWVRCVE